MQPPKDFCSLLDIYVFQKLGPLFDERRALAEQRTSSSFLSDGDWIFSSQSSITTDGQLASLSWNKAPIWGLRPDLDYCLTFAGLLVWGALS
jgi:hypothetical protein